MHFHPVDNTGHDEHISHGVESTPQQPEMNDTFDDVFGDEGGELREHEHMHAHIHPSDMRRLETEHNTAGYREGIALGKEATLQEGFDQGYSIGAAIGLQAGQLLGLLEGIFEAVKGRGDDVSARMERLLSDARSNLSVDSIFSPKYWTGTGEHTYDVAADETPATAHPLIRKWSHIVRDETERWAIDRDVLAHVNPQGPQDLVPEEHDHQHPDEPPPPTRNPLDW
jgi:hypothetical protein